MLFINSGPLLLRNVLGVSYQDGTPRGDAISAVNVMEKLIQPMLFFSTSLHQFSLEWHKRFYYVIML